MRGAVAALMLGLAVAGCASVRQSPRAQTAAQRGGELARTVCAACHAVEPGRDSPRPPAPPFASREMQHTAGLERRLAELTRGGHNGMPPMTLDDQQVRDVVAYIQSLAPEEDGEPSGPPASDRSRRR